MGGTFEINIDDERKVVDIIITGTWGDDKVAEFHKEYLERVYPIDTSDYMLLADGVNMDKLTPEMLPKLQMSFAFYKKSNFHEICFIIENNEVRNQVLKLVQFSGMKDLMDVTYLNADIREIETKILNHMNKFKKSS